MVTLLLPAALFVFLSSLVYSRLQALTFEVARLPRKYKGNAAESGPRLATFDHLAELPAYLFLENSYTIVMFAAPTCAPCHMELAELIEFGTKVKIPFICLADSLDDIAYQHFLDKYGDSVPIYPASPTLLLQFGVDSFPTFFLFDSSGKILLQTVLLQAIAKHLATLRHQE